MAPNKKPPYWLFVEEWISLVSDDETIDVYVEIILDGGREVHRTITQKTPCWDEDLKFTGEPSSMISVEVKKESAQKGSEASCVGRIEMLLETFLQKCSGGSTTLNLTLVGAESGMSILILEAFRLPHEPTELAASAANPQNDDQASMNSESYRLLIGTAEWADGLLVNESMGFYVDIKLDGERKTHKTKTTERPCWDEELPISGGYFSIIYFEIMQKSTKAGDQDSCIGRAEDCIEALLNMCADDESAALEITMIATESQVPNMGLLTVKLWKPADPTDLLHFMALQQIQGFSGLGHLGDLENVIANLREVFERTDGAHIAEPAQLFQLGIIQTKRYHRLGELSDLDKAIASLQQAVEFTSDGDTDKSERLFFLGMSQVIRYQSLKKLSDLDKAITSIQKAIALTSDGPIDKSQRLFVLGMTQAIRYQHLSELSDLDKAIASLQQAVELTSDGHSEKPDRVSSLTSLQLLRFARLGELPGRGSSTAPNPAKGRAGFVGKHREEFGSDEHPIGQRGATAVKITAAEEKYIEALDRLASGTPKMRGGLATHHSRHSPFGATGMEVSFPMEGLLRAIGYDSKVLNPGPSGSWYGAKYDALTAPSGSKQASPPVTVGFGSGRQVVRTNVTPSGSMLYITEVLDSSVNLDSRKRKVSDAGLITSGADSSPPKKWKGKGRADSDVSG